jgi:hypothetical protein
MSKININTLKEHIKNEGLKLMKESQAFEHLEDVIGDIDAGLITLYNKKFEKLKAEEAKAVEKEDYVDLKRVKEEQVTVLRKLIRFYEKKVEYLNKLGQEIETGTQEIGSKGVSVFSDKALNEFKNEEFLKGNKIKIQGGGKYFTAEKLSDNNVYKVIETNIEGVQSGDALKLSDMKLGGPGTVTVYRKPEGAERFEELKTFKFNNVREIVKNPS